MRIISQDGCYDIPYEKAVLHIFNCKGKYEIGVFSIDTIDDGEAYIRMARYFTKEKAIKTMEMCRKEYERYLVHEGGINLVTGQMSQVAAFQITKVFQFPKDEEVEV